MRFEPRLDGGRAADRTPLARRLGWLVAIWGASVALLGAVALVIRWWLNG